MFFLLKSVVNLWNWKSLPCLGILYYFHKNLLILASFILGGDTIFIRIHDLIWLASMVMWFSTQIEQNTSATLNWV